jgi:sigma-E factor negative regulatory protein RseB
MRRLRRVLRVAKRSPGAVTFWAASGCAALFLNSGARAADDDPRAWLARTDQALATLNYEGVFVHEHGGETETLRVIHRFGNDGVSERLLSMDGSGREFIRRGTQLTCYLPDKRTVLVEKSNDAGLLLASLPRLDAVSSNQYQISELSRTRTSGRPVRVINITPMDEMRYGYRVWVDEATAMPLKTQLRNRSGEVLEQLVFTDLRLPAHIADNQLQPAVDARSYRWIHQDADGNGAEVAALSVSWQAGALPPGFRMTTSARQMLPGGPVEHLVFTDGMASVSVFVEVSRDPNKDPVHDDAASLGSSSAYSTSAQGYRVTAVGEVPPDTVRAIALSIRPNAVSTAGATAEHAAVDYSLAPALRTGLRTDDIASIFDPVSGGRSAGPGAGNPNDGNFGQSGSMAAFGGSGTLSVAPIAASASRPGRH